MQASDAEGMVSVGGGRKGGGGRERVMDGGIDEWTMDSSGHVQKRCESV